MAGLKTEIDTDPLVRGYAAMDDAGVAADLNTSYRSRNRLTMTGDEVFLNINNRAAWNALTDNLKVQFLSFCARDEIDPFGAANVELIKSIFGDASATVTNLAAARVESITRAVEIGIRSPVRVSHVQAARS